MASKTLKITIKKKQELVRIEKEKIFSRLNEIRVEAENLVKKVSLPKGQLKSADVTIKSSFDRF